MPSSTHKSKSSRSGSGSHSKSRKSSKSGKSRKSSSHGNSELARLARTSAMTSNQKINVALPTHITNMLTGSIFPAKSRINVGGARGYAPLVPLITKATAPGWDPVVRNLNKLYDQSPQYVTTIPFKTHLDLTGDAKSGLALNGMAQTFSLADALQANNEALAELILRRNLRAKGGPEGPLVSQLRQAKLARAVKEYDIAVNKVSARAKAQNALYQRGDDERKLPANMHSGFVRGNSGEENDFDEMLQRHQSEFNSSGSFSSKSSSSASASAAAAAMSGLTPPSSPAAAAAAAKPRSSSRGPGALSGMNEVEYSSRKMATAQLANQPTGAFVYKLGEKRYVIRGKGMRRGRGIRRQNLTNDIGKPNSKTYDISRAYERARTIMGSLDSGNNSRQAKNQLSDLAQYLYMHRSITKGTYLDILKKYVAAV